MRLVQTAGASRAVFDRLPSRRLLFVVQAFRLLITIIHGRDDNALSKRLNMLCVRNRRLHRRIKPSNVTVEGEGREGKGVVSDMNGECCVVSACGIIPSYQVFPSRRLFASYF